MERQDMSCICTGFSRTYAAAKMVPCLAFFLPFFVALCSGALLGLDMPGGELLQNEEIIHRIPSAWMLVPNNERISVLQMLATTSVSTRDAIHTLQGVCFVEFQQRLDDNLSKELSLPAGKEVIQTQIFSQEIASDLKINKTFRSKNITQQFFDVNGERTKIENMVLYKTRTINSAEGYLFSQDSEGTMQNVSELVDFPEVQGKRVAWREPPEYAQKQSLVDLIDPLEFLDNRSWGNYDLLLEAMKGKFGKETQDLVNNGTLVLYETADSDGIKWYRLHQIMEDKDELNIFWSGKCGFRPVCNLTIDSSRNLVQLIQINWKQEKNCFYPAESRAVTRNRQGSLNFRRIIRMKNVVINESIPTELFSFAALGLEDGDILVDRIKQSVFKIENNKPVYLAKFYEKYQTPKERIVNRFRLLMIAIGVAMIAVGLYMKIRRKRQSHTAK